MNNIELIRVVLGYIDRNIREDITFESIAQEFNYSAYHFHRLFSAVAGETITSYIRSRRLDHVAYALKNTDKPVSGLCFEFGFESIQTFNRLFKIKYGSSPSKYRISGPDRPVKPAEMVITAYLINTKGDEIMMTPKFITKEPLILAGFEGYTGNGWHVIGEAWQELKARRTEIKNIVDPQTAYGFEDYSKDFKLESKHFYYMAGVKVSSADNLPEGVSIKKIPTANYAVFTVKGNNQDKEIEKAFRYIYDEWLPNSEYEYDPEVCGDFEYYDEKWDPQSVNSEMDIYIPVKKR